MRRIANFFLGVPLTIISFYFIGSLIYNNLNDITSSVTTINLLPLVVGLIFLSAFFLLRSISWHKLLEAEGFKAPFTKSIFLLSISEIKRYIPGSIFGFASRVNNFNALKISPRKTIKLIFYESIIFVLSSVIISIPAVLFILKQTSFPQELFFTILLSIIIISSFLIKKVNKKIYKFRGPFLLMFAAWIFYGIGSLLVADSFYAFNPRLIIELSSIFVLSWLVGYLVLIVPLGLGVREAAVTYGLSFFAPLPVAASVAVFSRFAFVIAEVLFLATSFVFYKFVKIKLKVDSYSIILCSAIASYISYFSFYSFEKHLNFFTGRFDLGNMDQTVWNTINGRIFEFTNPDGINVISRLSYHADFILILLAPFYLIWEDPRMLLLIQSVVLGLGAYFVFKIAERVLNNKFLSLAFSISFLLNPYVQKQNLFDFHAITLATTFLLATFYFSIRKNYKLSLFFLFLSVLTKENVYLISFIFGLYLFVRDKNKNFLLLSVASILVFYLLFAKFIPEARGSAHFASEYFQDFGQTPSGIIKNILFDPVRTLFLIFQPSNFSYLYKLFLPVGLISILSPLYLIFAIPDLAINLLSSNENLRTLTFHYAATIIPFIYISAIFGAKYLLKRRKTIFNTTNIGITLLAVSLFASFEYGVLPGAANPSLEIYENRVPQRSRILKFLRSIPSDLSVSASNNLGAHLSHRRLLFTIPHGLDQADVVVLLLNDSYASPTLAIQREYARELAYNPTYIELASSGYFVAFSKKSVAHKLLPY